MAELQQGRELADADEAANDAAGVASAATDDSDRIIAELRDRLEDAERRQHQAAAQACAAVTPSGMHTISGPAGDSTLLVYTYLMPLATFRQQHGRNRD